MTKIRVFALVLIVILTVFSCKKTPQKVGTDLQPTSSMITVSFTDASDIEAHTENVSSVPATNVYMVTLGNMNDSIFGISNFDFYTQLSLTTESQSWGENAVADSVVLNLVYSGYYGDTTEYLTVKVFELEEAMLSDTTYKSNQTFQYDPTALADHSFRPRPFTSPDTILDRGVLRIPIDPAFGDKLIANEASMGSNTQFKEFFKGFYVDCEQTNAAGAICYFNPTHSYTYLRVYYHNDVDTLSYDFGISSSTDVWVNHYTHDYSGHEYIFEDNSRLYLQGSAGTKIWINFPNIKEWADSFEEHVVINEAKLILTGAVSDTAMYTPPASLILVGEKHETDTTYVYLPDQYEGSSYYGGTYNKDEGNVWFRISLYIQQLVMNGSYQDLDGLYLNVNGASTVARRWAIYGNNEAIPDSLRLRLEVVYSLVNE